MDPFKFPPLPRQQFDDSMEWSYSMRRDMQEIIPNLYLGPYAAAVKSKLSDLQHFGITHIVCIRQSCEANLIKPNFPNMFKYLVLDIADSQTENIIRFFPKVRDFLNNCFLSGGKALVHGNAGISRSAALIIAYVMEKHGLSYRETYSYVQEKRFCINPNEGFAQQLREYEPIYRANLTLQYGHQSIETGRFKRKLDEYEDTGNSNEMMVDS